MMQVWVMSKSYASPNGGVLPVAWSYGYNHSSMGYQENGWGLVWLSLDAHQLEFIRAGVDPNVQFVGIAGKEMSPPTQLLLDTYADKLAGAGPFMLGQVLEKLGEWETRFVLERDPHKA